MLPNQIKFGVVFAMLLGVNAGACADVSRGTFRYASAQACASDRKVDPSYCSNAEANAAAEFDEKAPRFASRQQCERSFGLCSIGISGAAGWQGQSREIYFTPRNDGFVIRVSSERDMTVVPLGKGGGFAARSIRQKNTQVNYRAARVAQAARQSRGGQYTATQFGVQSPTGEGGPLPPPPNFDPNFNCAAYLEPNAKGDANTGCYPARSRQ